MSTLRDVKPMLLTTAHAPFDSPDWSAEIKWDGYRAIAYVSRDGTRLISRNGKQLNSLFPELDALYDAIGEEAVLDGEIVKLDASGRALFDAMRSASLTATFVTFDVLECRNRSLLKTPLAERQERLAKLLTQPSPSIIRSIPVVNHGTWLYEQMIANDGEGIVLKRLASMYVPGVRSADCMLNRI